MPSNMGRSNAEPSFLISAGARFTLTSLPYCTAGRVEGTCCISGWVEVEERIYIHRLEATSCEEIVSSFKSGIIGTILIIATWLSDRPFLWNVKTKYLLSIYMRRKFSLSIFLFSIVFGVNSFFLSYNPIHAFPISTFLIPKTHETCYTPAELQSYAVSVFSMEDEKEKNKNLLSLPLNLFGFDDSRLFLINPNPPSNCFLSLNHSRSPPIV